PAAHPPGRADLAVSSHPLVVPPARLSGRSVPAVRAVWVLEGAGDPEASPTGFVATPGAGRVRGKRRRRRGSGAVGAMGALFVDRLVVAVYHLLPGGFGRDRAAGGVEVVPGAAARDRSVS